MLLLGLGSGFPLNPQRLLIVSRSVRTISTLIGKLLPSLLLCSSTIPLFGGTDYWMYGIYKQGLKAKTTGFL